MTPPFAAHIAYVQLDPSRPAHPGLMGDEAEPQVEFERFTLRNGASNLVLNRPRDGAHPVARLLHWAGRIGRSFNLLRDTAGAFDAYLATGEDIGIPLALASLAFVRQTPIHITFHGHYIGGVRFALAMKVLRRFRHIHWHPLSTSLHGIMRHQLRIPEARCHNTGYAVDTDFFTPRRPRRVGHRERGPGVPGLRHPCQRGAGFRHPGQNRGRQHLAPHQRRPWSRRSPVPHRNPVVWQLPEPARALCGLPVCRRAAAGQVSCLRLLGHCRGDGDGQGGDHDQDPCTQRFSGGRRHGLLEVLRKSASDVRTRPDRGASPTTVRCDS